MRILNTNLEVGIVLGAIFSNIYIFIKTSFLFSGQGINICVQWYYRISGKWDNRQNVNNLLLTVHIEHKRNMADGLLVSSVNYASSQTSAAPINRLQMGGYDADFVSPISPDYLCPICQLAFRDPVQTRDCGHRFCESCLEPILRSVQLYGALHLVLKRRHIVTNLGFFFSFRKPPAFCPIDRRTLTREKVCAMSVSIIRVVIVLVWL